MTVYLLGALSGSLSVLSPCVLPLIPLVFTGASTKRSTAPLALAAGLVLSFTGVSVFIAAFGAGLDLQRDVLRDVAAWLLFLAGIVILSQRLQEGFVSVVSPLLAGVSRFSSAFNPEGLIGHFALGAMLGILWSPCAGPTLGAAAGLAMQSDTMREATFVMLAFGIGAAVPLVLLAYAGSMYVARRKKVASTAGFMKRLMGWVLVITGLSIITGNDKTIETFLMNATPEWLIDLTTKY